MDKISPKVVQCLIRNALFEDSAGNQNIEYGMYDRPAGGGMYNDDKDDDTTIPDSVPLKPIEMMATQLASERPPIEDENYLPGNADELGMSAAAISRLVPNDQIEYFYRSLHKLLDDATDRHNNPDLAKHDEKETSFEVPLDPKDVKAESRIRESWDSPDPRYAHKEDNLNIVDAAEAMSQSSSDGLSFDEIADQEGLAGASGAKQLITRLLGRLRYFAATVSLSDLNQLKDYAVVEFIKLLVREKYIDSNDAKELKSAPDQVKTLDSFRFFFVSAFVLPGYKAVNKEATKKVEAELDRMNIPIGMRQTIMNQVAGKTERDPQLIAKRLQSVAAKERLSGKEVQRIASELRTGYAKLVKLSEPNPDIVNISKQRWAKTRNDKKRDMLKQALQSTLDLE